jgi:hypothetical protein
VNLIEVDADDLATSKMIADELDMGHSTILNWVSRHESFPAPVLTVGPTKIYSRQAVVKWISVYLGQRVAKTVEVLRKLDD